MLGDVASIIVHGAMISAVYALIAIGFTMIFGVGGILNLAHGALIMFGAYVFAIFASASAVESIQLHPAIAFVLTAIVLAIISLALYEVLVRWIEDNVVITFLSTVVLAVASTEFVIYYFGSSPISMTLVSGTLSLGGVSIRYVEAVGFIVSWVLIGLLWYYVTQTDDGRSILATSMSERGANLTGVNIRSVRAKTWLIAGALAGVAGIFLGSAGSASPLMWLNPLALAFIIVVVGGIGSIKGSVVGAYLVGYLEQITVELLGHGFRGIPSLILLVLFMIYMPQGLFGREFIHE